MAGFLRWFFAGRGANSNRAAEDASTSKEMEFKLLAETSSDVIVRCNPDGRVLYVSPSSRRVFGWSPEDIVGKMPDAFVHPDDLPEVGLAIAQTKAKSGTDVRAVFRNRKKDGSWTWVESTATTIVDSVTGAPGDVVVVMRDITERKVLEESLAVLASTDCLTGLANRRSFDEAFEREWRRTLREGTQLSLLLIDVDHFKLFNDQYGHQVGDDCLRAIAEVLKNAVQRPGDMVARYGGEEIVVVLPNTDAMGAIELASSLCGAVEALRLAHFGNVEGGRIVTVSIGAATALAHAGGTSGMPAGLLQAADTALYKAKRNGRNRVEASFLLAPLGTITGQTAA